MKDVFEVTGLGLRIDKCMIMPGSILVLNSKPPSHWARFGDTGAEMEVATPAAAVEGGGDGKSGNDSAGEKTKKRKGLETQAGKLEIEFTDEMSDDDLQAAIKAAKEVAKS